MAKIIVPKYLVGSFLVLLAATSLSAQTYEDPLHGYLGYTNSYFLPFTDGTSLFSGNLSDAQVSINIGGAAANGYTSIDGGVNLDVDVDTGSRGLFVSSDRLTNLTTNSTSFYGTNDLTSSQKVYTGYYITTPVNFTVTNLLTGTTTIATATIPVLDVQTLGTEATGSTTFYLPTLNNITGFTNPSSGSVILTDGSSLSYNNYTVVLTNGQSMAYSSNTAGLLPSVSNFGIGFYLGTNGSGESGPVGNNTNQIFNALLNVATTNGSMTNGSLVSGYIIHTNGIQLGLTQNTTNFAYTQLQSSGLTSSNSVPDWNPSGGQLVVNGHTNDPGAVLLDTGIGGAYVGLTNSSQWNDGGTNSVTINLLNSGTNVGYSFTEYKLTNSGVTNQIVSPAGSVAPNVVMEYSKDGTSYFNSGKNVFSGFDMLYDASNGYLGLTPNGSGDTNIFFTAGFYANPVPEPSTWALIALGGLTLVAATRRKVF